MGKAVLEGIAGPVQGSSFDFDSHDIFLFGRGPDCSVALPEDAAAAPYHFLIEVNPPQMRLRDLGSERGTRVNGVSVSPRPPEGDADPHPIFAVLKQGDQIQVGESVFRVTLEADPTVKTVAASQCMYCGCLVDWRKASGSPSGLVCRQCRIASQKDPLQLLRAIMPKPAGYKRGEETPVLPGFTFETLLGNGPCGAVYRGRRDEDNLPAAIKLVLPKSQITEGQRRSLLEELESLRELQHPNLVPLFASGSAYCGFYFASELCAQGNVWDLMQQHGGKLPLDIATGILRRVLKGLAYAHENERIHRNIKPQNILLGEHEGKLQAKIGDFGLCAAFRKAGIDGLSLTGNLAAACACMPREHFTQYRQAAPAEDVWSVAAVFYAMVTGVFPRDTMPDQDPVLAALESPVLPLHERDATIPKGLAEVINTALDEEVNERYPNAGEFRAALLAAQKAI